MNAAGRVGLSFLLLASAAGTALAQPAAGAADTQTRPFPPPPATDAAVEGPPYGAGYDARFGGARQDTGADGLGAGTGNRRSGADGDGGRRN